MFTELGLFTPTYLLTLLIKKHCETLKKIEPQSLLVLRRYFSSSYLILLSRILVDER